MSAKRKLDIDEQKTRVIQAVQQLGLFSTESIYREFYDMTDEEISRMQSEIDQDQQKQMDQQQEQAALTQPGPGEAGGQEPAENIPPTANESTTSNLEFFKDKILEEDKKDVISRIIKKQHQKAEGTTKK